MNTYWISLPCDLLSSLASFQCSLLHHLHLSSDLGLSKYVNQHSHLNLSRNVRLSVLYNLDFNSTASSSAFPQPTVCCVCHCTPWWPHCVGSACASFPNKNHDGVHHCPWTNLYHYYRSVHWVTMDCCVKFCFSWLLCWFSKCVILLLFVLSNVFSHWLTFFFFFLNSFQIDLYLWISLLLSFL